jgi:hypothetical protein
MTESSGAMCVYRPTLVVTLSWRYLLVSGLVATGCSSSSTPPADSSPGADSGIQGTIMGQPVMVVDQSAVESPAQTQIRLANFAGVCAVQVAGNEKANGGYVKIKLSVNPPVLGTFPIDNSTSAEFKSFDAMCNSMGKDEAVSGTVTVTAVSASEVDGAFDLVLGSDHIAGNFAAPFCGNVPTQTGCSQ